VALDKALFDQMQIMASKKKEAVKVSNNISHL
jgi:hypothetical protein